MRQTASIQKNYIMNMILTVSAVLFPLITFPYVSRVLGPAGTGKVSLATSWITYFDMVAQLGIPMYGVRACAKVRDDREALTRTVHELLIINLVMCAISYAGLFVMMGFNPVMRAEKPLYLIISAMILFNSIGMEWLYKGLELYSYITKRSLIFKVIALAALFVLVRKPSDYVIYGAISIFALSASNLVNFLFAGRYIDLRRVGDYQIRHHVKSILIFFAMTCATIVYTNLDIVMLGHMKTDTDVGYYSAAVKIKNVLVTVVTALGTVLLPRVSYYVKHEMKEQFLSVTRKAMHFIFLVGAPTALFFILFARTGILILSGAAYEGAVLPMQILLPTVLLIGLSNHTGIQILVPLGREKQVLRSVIVGAIVDLLINLALIPRLGAAGAAIGTLCAEMVVLIIQWRELDDYIRAVMPIRQFGRMLAAMIPSVGAALLIRRALSGIAGGTLHHLLVLAAAAVAFFGIYVCILLLSRDEMAKEIIHRLFKRNERHRE